MSEKASPCEVCGQPTRSKYGVCSRSKRCTSEVRRRYWEANREKINAQRRLLDRIRGAFVGPNGSRRGLYYSSYRGGTIKNCQACGKELYKVPSQLAKWQGFCRECINSGKRRAVLDAAARAEEEIKRGSARKGKGCM